MSGPNRMRWYHAVAIFLIANGISGLPAGLGGDFDFYNELRLPSVAPPGWVFAPMWFFLNVTSLVALVRVANAPGPAASRSIFLVSEILGWVLFSVFTTAFFFFRSTVLGAVVTVTSLLLAVISVGSGWKVDRSASGLIMLRVLWLLLASYVSVYVAVHNADRLLGIGPWR